jgi:hypothetical protein
MPHAEICWFCTCPVNKKATKQIMPGVKILCYHCCKGARVHRWNDVPLVDAPPGNVSPINMIDHGPAQSRPCSVSLHHTDNLSHVTSATGLYYQSVMAELIADTEWTMDSTYHYPVKLIFQAHLRMYSLIHRQSCTTAQAALFQGICNVQSVQGIFTSELYSQNIPEQSTVQSSK